MLCCRPLPLPLLLSKRVEHDQDKLPSSPPRPQLSTPPPRLFALLDISSSSFPPVSETSPHYYHRPRSQRGQEIPRIVPTFSSKEFELNTDASWKKLFVRKFSIRTPPGNTFVGARNSNSRSSSVDLSQTASSSSLSPPHSFLTFISIFPIFLGAPRESERFNACHGMRRTKGRRRGGSSPL